MVELQHVNALEQMEVLAYDILDVNKKYSLTLQGIQLRNLLVICKYNLSNIAKRIKINTETNELCLRGMKKVKKDLNSVLSSRNKKLLLNTQQL